MNGHLDLLQGLVRSLDYSFQKRLSWLFFEAQYALIEGFKVGIDGLRDDLKSVKTAVGARALGKLGYHYSLSLGVEPSGYLKLIEECEKFITPPSHGDYSESSPYSVTSDELAVVSTVVGYYVANNSLAVSEESDMANYGFLGSEINLQAPRDAKGPKIYAKEGKFTSQQLRTENSPFMGYLSFLIERVPGEA